MNVIVAMKVGRSDDVIVALNDEKEAEGLENYLTQDINNSTLVSEWAETNKL